MNASAPAVSTDDAEERTERNPARLAAARLRRAGARVLRPTRFGEESEIRAWVERAVRASGFGQA